MNYELRTMKGTAGPASTPQARVGAVGAVSGWRRERRKPLETVSAALGGRYTPLERGVNENGYPSRWEPANAPLRRGVNENGHASHWEPANAPLTRGVNENGYPSHWEPANAPLARGINENGDAYRGGWGAAVLAGFTLLEMLMVIAIIGILAAMIGPTLGNFKPNATAGATQQLLTDISRARQLAMSQHTTVYMVFLQGGFAQDTACQSLATTAPLQWSNCISLLDKQYTGYNFVSLRNVGDQPGQHTPHYWSAWKTLPDGVFIATNKFSPLYQTTPFYVYANKPGVVGQVVPYTNLNSFSITDTLPFPSELAPAYGAGANARWTYVPYIAFNYLGQLVIAPTQTTPETLRPTDEIIPLARGSVAWPHSSATKVGNPNLAAIAAEVPLGNSVSNSFTLVCIDRLTGRAHVKRQEVK